MIPTVHSVLRTPYDTACVGVCTAVAVVLYVYVSLLQLN